MGNRENGRGGGFTLIEMLVALTLVGALSVAGYPWFLRRIGANVRVAAGDILCSFRLARARAISSRANVFVEFVPAGGAGGRGFYTFFLDKDGDRQFDPGEDEQSGVPQPDLWQGRLGHELPRGVAFGAGSLEKGPRGAEISPDGISFSGGLNRLGFYPKGNAGLGTIYVTNSGGEVRAVRILLTGAMEGWKWKAERSQWAIE